MKNSLLSALMVCSLTLTAVAAPALAFADSIDDQIEQQDQKSILLKVSKLTPNHKSIL